MAGLEDGTEGKMSEGSGQGSISENTHVEESDMENVSEKDTMEIRVSKNFNLYKATEV